MEPVGGHEEKLLLLRGFRWGMCTGGLKFKIGFNIYERFHIWSVMSDLSRLGHNNLIISGTTIHLNYFSYPGYGFQEFLSNPSLFDNLLQSKPDIVLVVLGGNDIKVHMDLSEVKSNCEQFYKLLREIAYLLYNSFSN